MHDFMQSLQMRWPVAATSGLSMQIIASAPSGQPSARSLWNSEMRSSSGQPASVTLNGDFLNGTSPGMRLLLGQAARARVLALLVAPDAVVRLVETADEIGAGIGQREAVALAQRVVARELPRRHAVPRLGLDRHEPHVVELARRAEQHAAAVRGAPRRGVRRPRRVAQREIELRRMRAPRPPASA